MNGQYEQQPHPHERPGPARTVNLEKVHIGRDANIAAGDLVQFFGLHQLFPHKIGRSGVLADDRYVKPHVNVPRPELAPPAPDSAHGPGVMFVVGEPHSGRRTTALHLLDRWLPRPGGALYELYPDWDQADVSLLPCRSGGGYLLNLTSSREPLSDTFVQQLPAYAERARAAGCCLIVLADDRVAGPVLTAGHNESAVPAVVLSRPAPDEVARHRLLAEPDPALRVRAQWLEPGRSAFAGLLQGGEPPAEGVRLAEVIRSADGPHDAKALDRYRGWQHKLTEWFDTDVENAPENRARQIAAAFLDGAPARVVLDAADRLLSYEECLWRQRPGGPLAGIGHAQQCERADLRFADGAISLDGAWPGAGTAVLQHVWRTRPQLVPLLRRWLREISGSDGIAVGHLDKIANAVFTLAQSEGAETVLDLVEEWLKADRNGHVALARDVLAQLCLDPIIGTRVRAELSGWAKAHTLPERQLAVIDLCRGDLGRRYPALALKRLQYVLASKAGEGVRSEAMAAVAALLADPERGARTLKTLTDWATTDVPDDRRLTLFLDAFDQPGEVLCALGTDPALGLLSRTGRLRQAVCELLRTGWSAAWDSSVLRARAAEILRRWVDAAEEGVLPADAVAEVAEAVFTKQTDALSDELDHVIGGDGELRHMLRGRFVLTVTKWAARNGQDDLQQVV
ncbi:hypothetical protein [Streptomyces sp. NPDC048172]|uniref:hypothetical protein n=1 Tax=Streptomyces sp. NPDC048172 TaxID=3365505 RepID=UPI0037152DAC